MTEDVTGINEPKALGYFEGIKGVFLAKLALLNAYADFESKKVEIPSGVLDALEEAFPAEKAVGIEALRRQNTEVFDYLLEDLVTTAVLSAWNVFELITKDLPSPDYSLRHDDISVNFDRNDFGLSSGEKDDLRLFYYVRNAIAHYNGAYYAYRSIDHRYQGVEFKSAGNEGSKIVLSPKIAFAMVCDIEAYMQKAWSIYKSVHASAT